MVIFPLLTPKIKPMVSTTTTALDAVNGKNFINPNGVQILFIKSKVYAKAVFNSNFDKLVELNPKTTTWEDLQRIELCDMI